MKSNKLVRIVAGIAVPVVLALSGCMSSGRGKLTLLQYEHDNRGAIGIPKDHIETVSRDIYGESQIYQQVTMPETTVNRAIDYSENTVNKAMDNSQKTTDSLIERSPIYKHYKNRDQ